MEFPRDFKTVYVWKNALTKQKWQPIILLTLGHFVERTQYKITPDLLFMIQRQELAALVLLYMRFSIILLWLSKCFSADNALRFFFMFHQLKKMNKNNSNNLNLFLWIKSLSFFCVCLDIKETTMSCTKLVKIINWFMNFCRCQNSLEISWWNFLWLNFMFKKTAMNLATSLMSFHCFTFFLLLFTAWSRNR